MRVGDAGGVVVEDLGPPAGEGAPESADLRHRVGGAAGDRLVEQERRVLGVLAQVDLAYRLLGQPGAEHLVLGIAGPAPPRRSAPLSMSFRIR
jgi:hypothetical protein